MDKDQITSNLGELIKNQIEICEKLDKMSKRIKKIGKPRKESNYDLNNVFGSPVERLDKIKFKQSEPKQDCCIPLETMEYLKNSQDLELEKQANELIDKFMPLVNGWDKNQPKHNECYQGAINEPVIGLWYYSQQNQRKAAIKCAIVHCELWIEVAFGHAADEPLLIKSQLQKMLSE